MVERGEQPSLRGPEMPLQQVQILRCQSSAGQAPALVSRLLDRSRQLIEAVVARFADPIFLHGADEEGLPAGALALDEVARCDHPGALIPRGLGECRAFPASGLPQQDPLRLDGQFADAASDCLWVSKTSRSISVGNWRGPGATIYLSGSPWRYNCTYASKTSWATRISHFWGTLPSPRLPLSAFLLMCTVRKTAPEALFFTPSAY